MIEQAAGSGRTHVVAHARTSEDGSFIASVPAGPSRTIEVAYRAFSADAGYAAQAKIEESVNAGVRLVITPRRTTSTGANTMSQRIQIVLPDPAAVQLRELAAGADTPPATLAAQLVRNGLALAAKEGKVRPLRSAPVLVGATGSERAPWLEPYGGDSEWRQQMWGAVVALHGRYPGQLQALNEGWWKDESQTETLCALAVWRAELDDTGQDPRDELAFQNQLADYAQVLRQQGGGVTKAWKPGGPPPEWAGE